MVRGVTKLAAKGCACVADLSLKPARPSLRPLELLLCSLPNPGRRHFVTNQSRSSFIVSAPFFSSAIAHMTAAVRRQYTKRTNCFDFPSYRLHRSNLSKTLFYFITKKFNTLKRTVTCLYNVFRIPSQFLIVHEIRFHIYNSNNVMEW